MDKASLLVDAVCYINELKDRVEELETKLQEKYHPKLKKVEVKIVGEDAMLIVQSWNMDWPSAKLMDALREMEAKVHHASMSCVNDVMLQDVIIRIPGATEDEVKSHLVARLTHDLHCLEGIYVFGIVIFYQQKTLACN
ncbi:hypothetical protein Hanom_Chr06g00498761 [Helianthus anomalus]